MKSATHEHPKVSVSSCAGKYERAGAHDGKPFWREPTEGRIIYWSSHRKVWCMHDKDAPGSLGRVGCGEVVSACGWLLGLAPITLERFVSLWVATGRRMSA